MMTQTDVSSVASTTSSSGELSPEGMEDKANYRKSNKPLMEKKRRARINSCLSQLKSLVLQAMKKDNSQYSKLEKADILELTVKHLKNVQRYQINGMSQVPDSVTKYRAGFNECANEVMRYLSESQGVNDEARARILSHLASILTPLNTLPLQQTHTPILPAPSQLQQQQQLQQQLQQLHHHHQQQQQQQQQGLFLTAQAQILTIDTNNNNNHHQSMAHAYHDAIVDKKNILPTAGDSPTAFQSPIATGGSPGGGKGLQLPCIAAMPTTQLHLVPGTLPSGQVALVLAPHAVPALNLYASQQTGRQQQHLAQQHANPVIKLEHNQDNPNRKPLPSAEDSCRLLSNDSPVALVTKSSRSHHRADHSTGPYKRPVSPYPVRSASTRLSPTPSPYDQRLSQAEQRQPQVDHRQPQADQRQPEVDQRQSQAAQRQPQADQRQSQADGSKFYNCTTPASGAPKFPLSSVNYNSNIHNSSGLYNNVVRATSTWRPW